MSKHHKLLSMYFLEEKEVYPSLNWLGEPLGANYQLLYRWMEQCCCPEPRSSKYRVKDSRTHWEEAGVSCMPSADGSNLWSLKVSESTRRLGLQEHIALYLSLAHVLCKVHRTFLGKNDIMTLLLSILNFWGFSGNWCCVCWESNNSALSMEKAPTFAEQVLLAIHKLTYCKQDY